MLQDKIAKGIRKYNFLAQHVSKVIWTQFIKDCKTVCVADRVLKATNGACSQFSSHDHLSDAAAVPRTITETWTNKFLIKFVLLIVFTLFSQLDILIQLSILLNDWVSGRLFSWRKLRQSKTRFIFTDCFIKPLLQLFSQHVILVHFKFVVSAKSIVNVLGHNETVFVRTFFIRISFHT